MGHSAEYGLALWATVENFVKRYGLRRRITEKFIEKLATTFKGKVRQKVYIYIMHYLRPIPSMLEILSSLEKIDSALWATMQNDNLIRISRRNQVSFEIALGYESGD
jgi:hypothetical protein